MKNAISLNVMLAVTSALIQTVALAEDETSVTLLDKFNAQPPRAKNEDIARVEKVKTLADLLDQVTALSKELCSTEKCEDKNSYFERIAKPIEYLSSSMSDRIKDLTPAVEYAKLGYQEEKIFDASAQLLTAYAHSVRKEYQKFFSLFTGVCEESFKSCMNFKTDLQSHIDLCYNTKSICENAQGICVYDGSDRDADCVRDNTLCKTVTDRCDAQISDSVTQEGACITEMRKCADSIERITERVR